MRLRALLPRRQRVEHVAARETNLRLQPPVSPNRRAVDDDAPVAECDACLSIHPPALEAEFPLRFGRHVDHDRAGADRISMLAGQGAPGEQVALAVLTHDAAGEVGELERMGAVGEWLEVPFDLQSVLSPHSYPAGAVSL